MTPPAAAAPYCGRLAPSPTGYLHLGHARTFWQAHQRARAAHGRLLLRNDDLDPARCRPEYAAAMQEDLRWLDLDWDGPMVTQSERVGRYRAAFDRLKSAGLAYPCWCSRRELEAAAGAPQEEGGGDEPLYPGTCRPENLGRGTERRAERAEPPCWRFRVDDGSDASFEDGHLGLCRATAGRQFGDFIVWRKDDQPSYQLACAVDDTDPALGVTEVVRGADLVMSTHRQLLIVRALGRPPPRYVHCPLMTDDRGQRLAKRHDSLSLRALRAQGVAPAEILAGFAADGSI